MPEPHPSQPCFSSGKRAAVKGEGWSWTCEQLLKWALGACHGLTESIPHPTPTDGLSRERLQGPWTVEPIQLPSALWDERVVVPASNHQVLTHSGGHQKVDTTAWPSVLTPHGQAPNEEGL